MFRGSTALLRHSSHAVLPVIRFIAATQPSCWTIGPADYTARREALAALYLGIGRAFGFPLAKEGKSPQQASVVLVTKVLLGVFGCTPAFDEYFITGAGRSGFAAKLLDMAFFEKGKEVKKGKKFSNQTGASALLYNL
jgi:hypothetical protein